MSLTRSTAERWSKQGVTCNAIMPGFVLTPLTVEAVEGSRARGGDGGAHDDRPQRAPDDFVGVTLLLATDAGAAITGEMVFVDGGFAAT